MGALTQHPSLSSRKKSTASYEVNYYPDNHLTYGKDLLVWSKRIRATKEQVLALCNEQKTAFWYDSKWWGIHWAFNNIPTEIEWNKITVDSRFYIYLRISPASSDRDGRLAILEMNQVEFRKE
jgi:hypothetical protein